MRMIVSYAKHSGAYFSRSLKGERNLLGSVPSMLSQAEHTSCEAYAFYVPYLLDSFKRHNKEGIQQAREGILKAY